MPDPVKTEERKPAPAGHVYVRILPKGDGKVFTGETPEKMADAADQYDGRSFFPTHSKGEIVCLPRTIALAQEDRGHVEIQA